MGRWGGERERVQEQWETVFKHAAETVSWSPAVEQFWSYTPELGPILGAVGSGVICFVHRKGPQTKEYRELLEGRKGKKIYSPFKISNCDNILTLVQ